MYMKKPSTQKITIRDFRGISADLANRGFVEEQKTPGIGLGPTGMLVASYKREFADFVLRVGASQDASDALAMHGREFQMENAGANLWAKCTTGANRNVSEFANMFGHKCHYIAGGSASGSLYHAELVPFPDPSILIDSCLKLGAAMGRVRDDGELSNAIDAKEVQEKIGAAQKQVREANNFAVYLGNYLRPLFESLRQKIDYEFARIKQDPNVLLALNHIADRE